MPDFVGGRPQKQATTPVKRGTVTTRTPPELVAPTARKKTAAQEENPIQQLKRLMKDFHVGLERLKQGPATAVPSNYRQITGKLPARRPITAEPERPVALKLAANHVRRAEQALYAAAAGKAPHPAARRPGTPLSEVRNLNLNAAELKKVLTQAGTVPAASISPAARATAPSGSKSKPITRDAVKSPAVESIRIPSVRPQVSVPRRMSEAVNGRLRPTATGADQEARRQYDKSIPADSPKRVPSAARLTQILKADALMKAGVVKGDPVVHNWANSIRAGKRRQVADLPPEQIQKVLHDAVGGHAAAQRMLNTPDVHSLIERHNTFLGALQAGLQNVGQKVVEGVKEHGRSLYERGKTSLKRTAATALARSILAPKRPKEREVRHEQQGISSNMPSDLQAMLATNEEPHLMAEQTEQQRAMHEAAPAQMSAREKTDQPRQDPKRQLPAGMLAPPRRDVVPALTAPPANPSKRQETLEKMGSGDKKGRRTELSGKLTLVRGGQVLGEAELSGDMRG